MTSIEKRINQLEKEVAHLKYKSLFIEGGETTFDTEDGRKVKINHKQYMELYSQLAQKVFNEKPIEHELLEDIKLASNGVGLYLKSMINNNQNN